MKKNIILLLIIIVSNNQLQAQGCVAIRGVGGMCMLSSSHADTTKWQLSINNRYFNSYKHFVGTDEQKQRVELGTQVINHAYTTDISITKKIDNRWSLSFNLPINSNTRSSLYEHGGKERHTTSSFGIGDVRFTVYRMLLNPASSRRGNIQLGLGLKLPTGDYKYQDYFYTSTPGVKNYGPVDQSIQLGDGGTGFTTELNGYYNLSHKVGFYGTFYYLINPRETNGVSTARGGTASATSIAYGSEVMSVPDQMMIRIGVNFNFSKFSASLGMRDECLPVHDLIGGSNGFRRPGYIISAEPGITYKTKTTTFFANTPIALVRDRTQSVPDKIRTDLTGIYAIGDAAFADYAINVGMSFKF